MRVSRVAPFVTVGLLATPLAAAAQQIEKVSRVGVLMVTPRASTGGAYLDALRRGLREAGVRRSMPRV